MSILINNYNGNESINNEFLDIEEIKESSTEHTVDVKQERSTNTNIDLDLTPIFDDTESTKDYNKDLERGLERDKPVKYLVKKFGNKTFRTQIVEDYIRPNIKKDIHDNIIWKDKWAKIAGVVFCLGEILAIIQTALAFTASSFRLEVLAFIAGLIGVLSIAFNRFGTYSVNKATDKVNDLNSLLKLIGIHDKIPNLVNNDDDKK